jgi:hypothetical protein
LEDERGFRNFPRKYASNFENLATIVGSQIAKKETNYNFPHSLYFGLSTGKSLVHKTGSLTTSKFGYSVVCLGIAVSWSRVLVDNLMVRSDSQEILCLFGLVRLA